MNKKTQIIWMWDYYLIIDSNGNILKKVNYN